MPAFFMNNCFLPYVSPGLGQFAGTFYFYYITVELFGLFGATYTMKSSMEVEIY